MAQTPNADEQALANINRTVQMINRDLQDTANIVKPYTKYANYKPYGPHQTGMHGTVLDEIGATLMAIHTNLSSLNKMLADLLPKSLGTPPQQ